TGCKPAFVRPTVLEEEPKIAAVIAIADPKTEVQVLSGFHPREPNGWRWTEGKFTVTLQAPAGAAEKGARQGVGVCFTEAVIERVKTVTISPKVNDVAIAPETYNKAGDYTYHQDVPAAALVNGTANVEFMLDHYLKAGEVEGRELGLIATVIGLEAK